MLRNPVDRAFSHYNMHKRKKKVNYSFEEIIKKELKELRNVENFEDQKADVDQADNHKGHKQLHREFDDSFCGQGEFDLRQDGFPFALADCSSQVTIRPCRGKGWPGRPGPSSSPPA